MSHIGRPQAGIEKERLFTFTIFRNVALFIFVFQRVVVPHLSTTGNTEIGVGKREKGGKAVAAVLVYCSV